MMKTTLVLLGVAACAALSASPALAAEEVTTIKHRTADGKTHVVKFYTTPIGEQCAYDETKDPSLYPCKDRGVCIRLNTTYGKCFTEAEATQIRKEIDSSDGSDASEEDDSASEDASASASGSDDVEFEDAEVGSEEADDVDDEEEDEEEEEGDVIVIRTDPLAH